VFIPIALEREWKKYRRECGERSVKLSYTATSSPELTGSTIRVAITRYVASALLGKWSDLGGSSKATTDLRSRQRDDWPWKLADDFFSPGSRMGGLGSSHLRRYSAAFGF
jgi:hypothetical protein